MLILRVVPQPHHGRKRSEAGRPDSMNAMAPTTSARTTKTFAPNMLSPSPLIGLGPSDAKLRGKRDLQRVVRVAAWEADSTGHLSRASPRPIRDLTASAVRRAPALPPPQPQADVPEEDDPAVKDTEQQPP